jgi:hypothetical protein
MPAPAPPPRLACKSADVQAGTPPVSVAVPEAAELAAALELAPALEAAELTPAAALGELDELALEPPPAAAGALDVDDDAAQPAARSPALSSGTTSNAFFTTCSLGQR